MTRRPHNLVILLVGAAAFALGTTVGAALEPGPLQWFAAFWIAIACYGIGNWRGRKIQARIADDSLGTSAEECAQR